MVTTLSGLYTVAPVPASTPPGPEGKTVKKLGKIAIACATVGVAAAALAPSLTASAHDDDDHKKTYTVAISGTDAGAAPNVWSGDADASLLVHITNTARRQTLGSANVTVPSGYSLVSAAQDAVPGGPVVELRNLAVAPGGSFDTTVKVKVASCAPSTPPAFAVAAKQSNDFNGTRNDFTLVAASSDLQVDTVGTCSLRWVAQPTSAKKGTSITTVDFDTAAAPISVEVIDGGATGRVADSTAPVTLVASNAAVAGPILGGASTAGAFAGLAVFSPTLSPSAFGYSLTATSPGLTASPASSTFAIVDDQVACGAGTACTRPASASQGTQTVTASFGAGSTAASLLVSIGAADAPSFTCAGYAKPAGIAVTQFTFTGAAGDRTGTMSSTIPATGQRLSSYQVCWAAPYPFTTSAGTPAGVQGTKPGTSQPLYVGLLPNCKTHDDDDDHDHDRYRSSTTTAPVPPCISARRANTSAGTVTLTVLATGDDPWRY